LLESVQVLRQRAEAAGTLQSTPQQSVSYNQGNVVVQPVDPQTVYVPSYDPWNVYGQQISPYPGFSLLGALGSFFGSDFGSSAVRFGLGIAMSAFSHMSWGWLGWGLNWLAQAIFFHQSNYFTQSSTVADWGLPRGGPRAYLRDGAAKRLRSGLERVWQSGRWIQRPDEDRRSDRADAGVWGESAGAGLWPRL